MSIYFAIAVVFGMFQTWFRGTMLANALHFPLATISRVRPRDIHIVHGDFGALTSYCVIV